MTEECWLPVVGWEGLYEVSDQGRVRSLPRNGKPGRVRSLGNHQFGYKLVTLVAGKRKLTVQVHSTVLTAFVGPRPAGLVGCHNDGDPTNNVLSNLRWDTQSSNLFDAIRHGNHTQSNKTHCPQGHEYSLANTTVFNGWRTCRECKRIWDKDHRVPAPRGAHAEKTHCPQGHEYTDENTKLHKPQAAGRAWRRSCKTCSNEQRRARRATKRQAVP